MNCKAVFIGLLLLMLAIGGVHAQQVQPKVFILMRHAEKQQTIAADPPLTKKGEQQAQALASLLKDQPVKAVYSTPYQRTQHTAQPLATAKNVEIAFYDPAKGVDLVAQLKADTTATSGATVLIGHSNTIPALVNALCGRNEVAAIPEEVYGQVFVVTIDPQGQGQVVRLRLPDTATPQ